MVDKTEIRARVLRSENKKYSVKRNHPLIPPNQMRASVLAPLLIKDGEIFILLTVRAKHLRRNAGEVALPGGKMDEGDEDEIDTALRETFEEVGLVPGKVEVIGQLCPFMTMHKPPLMVTPVIAFIEDFNPVVDKEEVDETFYLPLKRFLSSEGFKRYPTGHVFFEDIVDNKKYYTWGLTAWICIAVASVVFARKTEYELITGDGAVKDWGVQLENWLLQMLLRGKVKRPGEEGRGKFLGKL